MRNAIAIMAPPAEPRVTIPLRHSISVVLPAHNEEAVVEQTLTRCLEVLAGMASDYEVILVDDGSRDRTGEIADAIAARDPHLRVVHNRPNRGYGGALRAGFEAASKQYTFFMDSDGQFDIAEIAGLLARVEEGFPAVLGYRAPRRDPFMRLLNAWGWNLLISGLFRLRVRDIDCAFKVYDTRLVRAMEVAAQGATINAEMLIKLTRMGVPFAQVRVTHYPRLHGAASGASPRVILRAFRELLRLRGRLRTWTAAVPLASPVATVPAREELPIGVS
jgi:glycosyltransferase involved in cell wall biosynthesis